jgi:hypothetical protein
MMASVASSAEPTTTFGAERVDADVDVDAREPDSLAHPISEPQAIATANHRIPTLFPIVTSAPPQLLRAEFGSLAIRKQIAALRWPQ